MWKRDLLKLGRGEADAIILAQAGLIRLNLSLPDGEQLSGDEWLPALCQGIVGIETRGARWRRFAKSSLQSTTPKAISPHHVSGVFSRA